MPDKKLEDLLRLYNPWWSDPAGDWRKDLPEYRRPIVSEILSDLDQLPQMVSVTGPRRVGKTTALHQVIATLISGRPGSTNLTGGGKGTLAVEIK